MTIPLVILAILSIIGGFVGIPELFMSGGDRLTAFLAPVIPQHNEHHVSHNTEYMLMGLSTILVLIMIIFAWIKFKNYKRTEAMGFGKVLENKWYVDEIYDRIIVQPLHRLGGFFKNVIGLEFGLNMLILHPRRTLTNSITLVLNLKYKKLL